MALRVNTRKVLQQIFFIYKGMVTPLSFVMCGLLRNKLIYLLGVANARPAPVFKYCSALETQYFISPIHLNWLRIANSGEFFRHSAQGDLGAKVVLISGWLTEAFLQLLINSTFITPKARIKKASHLELLKLRMHSFPGNDFVDQPVIESRVIKMFASSEFHTKNA